MLLPVEGAGTSDTGTVAAAGVGGVSVSKVKVDPAGHDREAAGPVELERLAAVGAAAAAAVAVGGPAAAAEVGAAAAAAPVLEAAGNRTDLEDPADFEDPALAAAAEAAGEGRREAVLAGNVGAGYKEADLERGRGGLGTVGKGILTVRVVPVAVKDDPAGNREFQNCPGAGQGTTAAADQGGEGGRADRSRLDSAGRSLLGLAVRRLTSR